MVNRVACGLVAASVLALVAIWAIYLIDPSAWPGIPGVIVQSVIVVLNIAVTLWRPQLKVAFVTRAQRWVINPVIRGLFAIGINPLGLVLLETRGRRSGLPRVTPVGNGRRGDTIWVIAEHGLRAQYVRNILADPSVRVRAGGRRPWIAGVATVLQDDDPMARQRIIVGHNPLRALNAWTVRLLGADLVTVRIALDPVAEVAG